MKFTSIAVDGPSGAGKSTLAKQLAKVLGYLYVDTGAIYRTVGLYVKQQGMDPTDAAAVIALLDHIKIELNYAGDGLQHMYLNGADVTEDIRRHEISEYASAVSALPQVRAFLMEMQRSLAGQHSVIMDGRDIGTVVLPHADVKIFLTATPEDRAGRRCAELLERGERCDLATILADVNARDARDMGRAAAPLRQAEDAILVDTTGYSLEESFALLLKTIKEHLPA